MTWQETLLNLNEIDLLVYRDQVPEFKLLETCPQDKNWHREGNVLVHTNMALAKARELALTYIPNLEHQQILYLATLLHDVGKPQTTFTSTKSGRLVAYNHEGVGVSIAKDFLWKYFSHIHRTQREEILKLVEFHGHPKRMVKGESSDKRFFQLSCEVNTELVYYLEVADFNGREGVSSRESLEYLEKFKKKCQQLDIWGKSYCSTSSLAQWRDLFGGIKKNIQAGNHELVFTIGAPASGKTTYLKKYYPQYEFISMDEERLRVCGTMADMSRNEEVYNTCFQELSKKLRGDKSCVWDATSLTRKWRRRMIQLARNTGAKITIIYFDLPLKILYERNKSRKRQVPENVIEGFYRKVQLPAKYEYDNLITIVE